MSKKKKFTKIKNYVLKNELLYDILKCPEYIDIPCNDFDAWWLYSKKNRNLLWIYNKLQIAQSQNLKCGPLGVYPKKYPVFVKPIMNLYGMGKDGIKVKNEKHFQNISRHETGKFWTEFLTGDHLSIDIIILRGKIKKAIAFKGHFDSKKIGTFEYWESLPDYTLSSHLAEWIKDNFKSFTGIINIETIGDKIIECHLRMGDLNQLDIYNYMYFGNAVLFKSIIDLYEKEEWNLKKNYEVPKIYLIPIFVDHDIYESVKKIDKFDDVFDIAERYYSVFMIQRDPKEFYTSSPDGGIRVYNLTCFDLQDGMKCKKKILNHLKVSQSLQSENDNKYYIDPKLFIIFLFCMILFYVLVY